MAKQGSCERWAFEAEWLDSSSGVRWTYQLFAYLPEPATHKQQQQHEPIEIEMFDIKNRRHFIKRVKCDSALEPAQLYVGSTVTVFSRQLHLISYGDDATRRAVEARAQRTLALILPDATQHTGKILHAICQRGFSITNMRMCQPSTAEASAFLAQQESTGNPLQQHPATTSLLASGPIVAMELMAASGVRKWLDMLGPDDVATARQQAPDSIRGLFATTASVAALGSSSPSSAEAELAFFFAASGAEGRASASTSSTSSSQTAAAAQVHSCCRGCGTTLGVILPHAVKDGVAGLMLEEVQAAFDVTGLQLFNLPKQAAAEFLEVYKAVVPPGEYRAMVDELVSGPCIAVEVAARDGSEPVEAFRQLVGPRDPELARVLRPGTLRARFGVSRSRPAMHCTDLPEDGELEVSYFFSVLQQ